MPYEKFDHDKHAGLKEETDFWGQIRRTVNGKAVDQTQIDLILHAAQTALLLGPDDILLDLACGNGALGSQLFREVAGYRGVDFSPTLISIARKYFEKEPDFTFVCSGASEYVEAEDSPLRYTKALCYGSFSYFSPPDAVRVLQQLNLKYRNVRRVFIGNLPDRSKAARFYGEGRLNELEMADHESAIGIWRDEDEAKSLAVSAGWNASVVRMPAGYYAAHYRFDMVLSR